MIKTLPPVIKLPNYNITIEFKDQELATNGFGELSYHNFKVTIAKMDDIFNMYLYTTFLIYSIASAYDINIVKHKAHVLGLFFYHVLHFNSLMKIFKTFSTNLAFKNFKIGVPSFDLDVLCHDDDNRPLGVITASKREIQIHKKCDPQLKNVILVHELVEWANTMYNLQMKHIEIQTLAEGLVYILNENKFTS